MEYRFLWFVSTCNNDFEANSTSLMSLWANIKFFPEPTGKLYGWLLATLVTEVPVNIWKKIYIRVFVKTTLGIAFHHLDPTFINAYIVKLLQTWITLDKPF